MRNIISFRSIRWAFIGSAAALVLIAYFLDLSLKHRRFRIPPPVETNRISHPKGFSIVKPYGWLASKLPNLILISESDHRYSDFINVFYGLKSPGQVPKFTNSFQGKPAYRHVRLVNTGVDKNYTSLDLVFERYGQVFEIVYIKWGDPTSQEIPSEIMSYLETFSYTPTQPQP